MKYGFLKQLQQHLVEQAELTHRPVEQSHEALDGVPFLRVVGETEQLGQRRLMIE